MNKINPISYFPNPDDGRPLSGGKLYVGLPDTDPEIVANQKQVYALQEDNTSVPISQPITLSTGGTPQYNGANVTLYVDGLYSAKVLNSSLSQIYYIPNSILEDGQEAIVFDTFADMLAVDISSGTLYETKGYLSAGDGLGAKYYSQTSAQFGITPDEHKDGTGNNGNIAKFIGFSKIEGDNPAKKDYHTGNFNPDSWSLFEPEGGDYHTFPIVAQNSKGRIVVAWMHQTQHTGSAPADVVCRYSDDGGASFSADSIIYGTLNGPDTINPYIMTFGVDRWDRFICVFNIYASNPGGTPSQPWVSRSWDGVNWSTPVKLTFSGDTVGLANSIFPFGEIKLLPSGKLGVAVYQQSPTETNYIGIIDDDSDPFNIELRAIVVAPAVSYSEHAFVAVTEDTWFAFMRQDGATNSIPYYSSIDAGTTWAYEGTMGDNGGIQVGGGWVVQCAERATIEGTPHILVGIGARKSASAPITGAPAVMWFAAKTQGVLGNSSAWFKVHEIPFTDDGYDRDAYNSIITNDATGDCFVVTNEETATDESRVLSAAFNYKEKSQTAIEADINFNGVTVTYTDQIGRFIKSGNLVTARIEINYTALDTADPTQISIVVSDFPYAVVNTGQCQIDLENSTGLNFAATDVVYCNFAAGNLIVQLNNPAGTAYAYNSGKILAAGSIIWHVQYETS